MGGQMGYKTKQQQIRKGKIKEYLNNITNHIQHLEGAEDSTYCSSTCATLLGKAHMLRNKKIQYIYEDQNHTK